jgi:ornithine cyclodeaminase
MRNVDAAAVHRALDYGSLIEALRAAFRAGCELPVRHHHTVTTPDGSAATLLLMPAWRVGGRIGVKTVTVFPGNAARGLPSVMGVYLLLDGATGAPLALIDGVALTLRRTAAASALAASYLARPDAWRLVMVGAGALAPHLVRAHAAARPIREVAIWNRSPARAEALAADLAGEHFAAAVTSNLAEAVAGADIVSCATLSHQPLVRGEWLRPGTHLDLVGAFTPAMREADDAAVRRARLFVDTRGGALKEAGDIVQPLRAGLIGERDVEADLFELCRGEHRGRSGADEITLFKSVGTALEDLAAAELVYDRAAG